MIIKINREQIFDVVEQLKDNYNEIWEYRKRVILKGLFFTCLDNLWEYSNRKEERNYE